MIGGQTDADLDPGVGDIQDQQGERVMLIYYLKRELCFFRIIMIWRALVKANRSGDKLHS